MVVKNKIKRKKYKSKARVNRRKTKTLKYENSLTTEKFLNYFKLTLKVTIITVLVLGIWHGIEKTKHFFYTSKYFNIAYVKVNNNSTISEQYIKERFNNYCLENGLSLPANIFKIDSERLYKYILNQIPVVKNVTIQKHYPNKIILNIFEYKPAAIVRGGDNGFYSIDEDGNIFKQFINKNYDLPVITGLEVENLKIGSNADNSKVVECLKVINYLPKSMKNKVSEIRYKKGQIYIYTKKYVTLKLGLDGYAFKLNSADIILSNYDKDNLEYIDLRFKDIYIKRRSS